MAADRPVQLGLCEQVVDELGEPVGVGDHRRGTRLRCGEVGCAFADLQPGAQRCDRAPQLVRGVGDEPALGLRSAVQPVEQVVHRDSQLADLVACERHVDPLVEPGC